MTMSACPVPCHEFLAHTGELRLLVRAATMRDLFAEAGRAVGLVSLRGAKAAPAGDWRTITLEAPDRVALLVDWLNELVFLAERDRWVAVEFQVSEAHEQRLSARARGVTVDEPPTMIKAATLHGARITPAEGAVEAEVTFDV